MRRKSSSIDLKAIRPLWKRYQTDMCHSRMVNGEWTREVLDAGQKPTRVNEMAATAMTFKRVQDVMDFMEFLEAIDGT